MKPPCDAQDVVWVEWDDAVSNSTRGDLEAAATCKLARYVSLGWIVDRNDKRIILAHGVVDTGEMDFLAVPVSSIIEERHVTKARKSHKAKQAESAAEPGGNQ